MESQRALSGFYTFTVRVLHGDYKTFAYASLLCRYAEVKASADQNVDRTPCLSSLPPSNRFLSVPLQNENQPVQHQLLVEAFVLLLMRLSAARSPAIQSSPAEIAQLDTLLREAAAALADVRKRTIERDRLYLHLYCLVSMCASIKPLSYLFFRCDLFSSTMHRRTLTDRRSLRAYKLRSCARL